MENNNTPINATPSAAATTTWTVYHGGKLYGLGRWSGPHTSRAEALESARECAQVCGGSPRVVADQAAEQEPTR